MKQKVFPIAPCHRGREPRFFEWTGEKRPPKGGEWYLSGAIPEVYYDPKGGGIYPYHIMREITPPPKEIEHEGFVYKRVGPAK